VEAVIHERHGASTVVVTGCPLMTAAARVLYPDADAFLEKPCTPEELLRRVREAAHAPVVDGRDGTPFHGIVGVSPEIRRVIEQIHQVGPTDSTVLVTGETGTGKELVARAIHQCSRRRDGPYVVVDALAMSESLLESELFGHERGAFTGAVDSSPGLFRAADGGTIFLDEMGEVSPAIQTRLLRAIQEREVRPVGSVEPSKVDVRVIAATHRDPAELVDSGHLRADLYYRLSVYSIEIPPLRERRVDIPALVAHFLRSRAGAGDGVDGATELAEQILQSYDWPGNVRELLAAVEAGLVRARGRRLSALDLPRHLRVAWRGRALSDDDVPASVISRVLRETNGNRGDAAELLGVSRTTLWRWMKRS
jgi:two-component system response regulator HydG